jgi:SH3-like domain-containing protein
MTGRAFAVLFACLLAAALIAPGRPEAAESVSGLPIPRFVSLKSDKINVRKGPGTTFGIAWVFKRAGLPVEIIDEVDAWRQVRDSEGEKGWVLQSLLSGRRTAIVRPWDREKGEAATSELRESAGASGRVVALVEAGTLVGVVSCDRAFCLVSVEGERGYLKQKVLWGVYEDETIE